MSPNEERSNYVEERANQIAQLSLNELSALSAILQFYERYLWNTAAPSAKRSRQWVEVYALIVKLFLLPSEKAIVLTVDEVGYLKAALNIFTSQIVNTIPPSESRDGVLESCHQLQEYIVTVFTPKQA
jgi:hypothetical protein